MSLSPHNHQPDVFVTQPQMARTYSDGSREVPADFESIKCWFSDREPADATLPRTQSFKTTSRDQQIFEQLTSVMREVLANESLQQVSIDKNAEILVQLWLDYVTEMAPEQECIVLPMHLIGRYIGKAASGFLYHSGCFSSNC